MGTEKTKICVVGLGYVGLPLAVEFGKYFSVIGFDINEKRVGQLSRGIDSSDEVEEEKLKNSKVMFTSSQEKIKEANFIVICVPTPVDKVRNPDLSFLKNVSELVGRNLAEGSIVVYESTVYPGCTEEVCVPLLEKFSELRCGTDFKVGYSPERINPGDKEHTLDKVVKIAAGMDDETTEKMALVYGMIVKAGIHRAPDIKTAEAAKVIENIQRDLNIALMNELAIIFDKIGVKTRDVLEAAGTKWNWHDYKPGLCGGHCIPVDPYYLTYKAVELGHHPEVILAGRRINDNMYKHIVNLIIRELNTSNKILKNSQIILMGLSFKENVKDSRNSKAKELIDELRSYGIEVFGCDPLLGKEVVKSVFGVEYRGIEELGGADGLVVVSPHKMFKDIDLEKVREQMRAEPFIIDLKGFFEEKELLRQGFSYRTF